MSNYKGPLNIINIYNNTYVSYILTYEKWKKKKKYTKPNAWNYTI